VSKSNYGKIAAGAVASIGLLHAQAAFAQQCIAPEDLTDAGIYAIPVIAEGFAASCTPYLESDGFFASRGEEFVAPYAAMQTESWPGTLRVFMSFATSAQEDGTASERSEVFGSMPPEALRPFVDAFLAQKIGEEIKPDDCAKIERAMELLAPLPPENFGGLLTFVLDISKVRDPQVCDPDRP
jgi:hypothetical protein